MPKFTCQHIANARRAKAQATTWAIMGHTEKVAYYLRIVQHEVWIARQARKWNRAVLLKGF